MKQRLKNIRPPATPRLSVTITLTIIASLLTALAGVMGNIATASLPDGLKPYLSYAWLVLLVLVLLGIVVTAWQAWYDSGQGANTAPVSVQSAASPGASSPSSPTSQSASTPANPLVALIQPSSAPANAPATPTQSATSTTPVSGSSLYHSCVLSYATEDEQFVKKLYADLQAQGVPCWFAPHDLRTGDQLRTQIYAAIQKGEKLLLILSEHAVKSDWVEREVELAFELEHQPPKTLILFPTRIDEAVMHTNIAWAADIRRLRFIGDFRQWQDDVAYQQALQRLLRDLHV